MRNSLRRYINPRNRDPIPGMSLLFARDKALDPMVDFTRASENASYYSAAGVLSYAALNEPRFTHDPVTGQSLGLLIEESRTNLLTYSEEFDNAAWTKNGCSISANATAAPDGAMTSDKLVESASDEFHYIASFASVSMSSQYTFSVMAKNSGRDFLQIIPANSFPVSYANFDILNGVVGGYSGVDSASIEQIGSGWFLCTVTATANASGSAGFIISPQASFTAARAEPYTGDGTSGIYIWGAQLEAGSFPTSYIKTTSSTATRAADSASITGANFSSWYNQEEGTFVVDYENGLAGYVALAAGSDTLNIIRLVTRLAGSSDEVFVVLDGGSSQVSLANSPSTQRNICAASYKQNDFAVSMNGDSASTKSSGTVPTADTLAIGGTHFYGAFNGTIASIAYYPTRLSNSYLQYLTS